MRVLILANGEPPSAELAQRLAAQHDLLLATDGAAQSAIALGVRPDIVCGDFDSVQMDRARQAFPQAEFIATPDQDFADLEKSLRLARERGATAITITGAAGGRIDHTLANFVLLLRYGKELTLSIVGDGSRVWPLIAADANPAVCTFATRPGDTVSLITFEEIARVSLHGVRWAVQNFALSPGTSGVSNVALGDSVSVTAHRGAVLVCHLGVILP